MIGVYCRTSREESIANVDTIQQQEAEGIQFAEKMGWNYKVYKDKGKSGFKDFNDEADFIEYRPEFANLLTDIKEGVIDSVWVWEQSRLCRNTRTFDNFVVPHFKTYKTILYVKGDRRDFNNPQDEFIMGIFSQFSMYERQLIVSRTHRGQLNAINNGKGRNGSLYGYTHTKGNKTEIPVAEELETAKQIFTDYLENKMTLKDIARKYFYSGDGEKKLLGYVKKVKQILSHFEYTAESLNVNGREILKAYREGKIESISCLIKDDYWTKSNYYTNKIIERKTWLDANERLQIIKLSLKKTYYKEARENNNSLASGLLFCKYCQNKYYYKDVGSKHGGIIYKHISLIDKCKQERKQIITEKIDIIFSVCFTYYNLCFDSIVKRIQEQKSNVKLVERTAKKRMAELESKIASKQKFITKMENEITKDEVENISILVKQIDKATNDINEMEKQLELEKENIINTEQKTAELDKAEKYQKNVLNSISAWFDLLDKKAYSDLRIIWKNTFNGAVIDGSKFIITPIAQNPEMFDRFVFDLDYDYKIIFKFIEKIIGRKINAIYNETELNWINEHQEEIDNYEKLVKNYLINREKRTEKKIEFKYLMKEKMNILNVFYNKTFSLSGEGTVYNLLTYKANELNGIEYKTTNEVAKIFNKPLSTLRDWGKRNGVKSSVYGDGVKRMQWTEQDIERYDKSKHCRGGRTKGKKYPITEKQMEHLKKIKGLNQTPEAKAKRAKSLKKYHKEINK